LKTRLAQPAMDNVAYDLAAEGTTAPAHVESAFVGLLH
jgi:hypothetical protein